MIFFFFSVISIVLSTVRHISIHSPFVILILYKYIYREANTNHSEPGCSGVSKARAQKRINSNDSRSSHNNSQEDNKQNKHQSDSQSDSEIRHQSDNNKNKRQSNNLNRQQSDINGHRSDIQIRHQHDSRSRHHSDNDSQSCDSHNNNSSERNIRDSDSSGNELVSESRTRRPRKAIVYKEKPLNR